MLKDRGLRGRCPTCAVTFDDVATVLSRGVHACVLVSVVVLRTMTVYGRFRDRRLSVSRHDPSLPPLPPPLIGRTVVDLICESAIIELTSCTIGNWDSRSKKKRS